MYPAAAGTPLAHLNLASRKFCSGLQKYVVPNTCLVVGTVRRCAIWTGKRAGPTTHAEPPAGGWHGTAALSPRGPHRGSRQWVRLRLQLSRALAARSLRAGPRPQLLLQPLHHLLQMFAGLTLSQQVGPQLLAVSLRVLQLHLQILNLG